jgi:adenylate cyclase
MGKEIERKFLVIGERWRRLAKGARYRQGYLSTVKERTVRVRTVDHQGTLTVKGISVGATRSEYEYKIPAADADEMIDHLCEKPIIEKNRYKIPLGDVTWEVDEFLGTNQGLIGQDVIDALIEVWNLGRQSFRETAGDLAQEDTRLRARVEELHRLVRPKTRAVVIGLPRLG